MKYLPLEPNGVVLCGLHELGKVLNLDWTGTALWGSNGKLSPPQARRQETCKGGEPPRPELNKFQDKKMEDTISFS
jgi:hypothetical protein